LMTPQGSAHLRCAAKALWLSRTPWVHDSMDMYGPWVKCWFHNVQYVLDISGTWWGKWMFLLGYGWVFELTTVLRFAAFHHAIVSPRGVSSQCNGYSAA
jgi:hypothetical protein